MWWSIFLTVSTAVARNSLRVTWPWRKSVHRGRRARQEMKACVKRWEQAGFDFDLDWLLRNITTILTGQAMFSALKDIATPSFQEGLKQAEKTCNYLLNIISGRLGLDHDRVLGGRYAFPVMTCYLAHNGGKLQDARQRDKLLYWYIQSFLSEIGRAHV